MGLRPETLNPRASSPDSWYGKNLLGQALKNARKILRRDSTTPPDDPAPEIPIPRDVTGDTVFEVDPITHLRLDTTLLPANAQTAAPSTSTDSVPDDHASEVLLAHEQRDDAPLMPEQGPDLIGGIITMDDVTFTTLLTLHSGVSATSRFDCRAILDSYLAAGLIQHSTSPLSSPLICVHKKTGGIRITVNYQKLNKVIEIPQIAIPRVDEVFDTLGGGSVLSVFDLFSGFTQLTIHPDTIPLTAFCTPNGLYEWLRMPPGAAGAPAWFVSVMRFVTAGLDNILMYLDDAIGQDDCPLHHVATLATFFAQLRLHKLKLSPDKSRIGAARVDFLGHIILADGVRPNDARVAALARMPMPTDVKQLRSLLGGLSYYRKFLPNMAHHIRPVTALLKRAPRLNSPPQWRIQFARFSRNSPHSLYSSFRTGTRSSTRLGPSACIATPAPLASEPPSNKNSQMAPYAPSSTSAEPPSTMSRTGPLWNSKPDASCGVSDASDATYSVCTSSFSLIINAFSKSAR